MCGSIQERVMMARVRYINSTHSHFFSLSEMNVKQTTKLHGRINSDIEWSSILETNKTFRFAMLNSFMKFIMIRRIE